MKDLTDGGFIEVRTGVSDRRRRLLHVTPAGGRLALDLAYLHSASGSSARLAPLPPEVRAAGRSSFLLGMIDASERERVVDLVWGPAARDGEAEDRPDRGSPPGAGPGLASAGACGVSGARDRGARDRRSPTMRRICCSSTTTGASASSCRACSSRNGYRVTLGGHGGGGARAICARFAFDLLVLDVMMPGETGIAFAADVRRSVRGADPDVDRARRGGRPGTGPRSRRRRLSRQALRAARTPAAHRLDPAPRRAPRSPNPTGMARFGPFAFHRRARRELRQDDEPIRITDRERDMLSRPERRRPAPPCRARSWPASRRPRAATSARSTCR